MKHNVVACIPSKDTGWLLKKTIPHLLKFCSKVIISDDNSSDDTSKICLSYDNVIYQKRPIRNKGDRQGALQRQELLDEAYKHDPDYFFFLDADEMPSPSIINWINSLNSRDLEKNNLWTFPWVHLWGDENHYRIDSYVAKNGASMHWDPFSSSTYRKGFFARNIPNFRLQYDVTQHRVRPSNQPINTPKPWVNVMEDPVIVHYGKISNYFITGQNWSDRAIWDQYEKNADPNKVFAHHKICNSEDTLKLKKIKDCWKWRD